MAEHAKLKLAKLYAPAVQVRLARFASKEQLSIAAWLAQNPIGTNYAMQVLEFLEDLSKKENIRPSILLRQIIQNFEEDKLHPKELGRRLRDHMYRKLHPKVEQHRLRFEAFSKSLALPQKTKLIPPQNFEGISYQLEVTFENISELHDKLKEVMESLKKGKWKGLEEF
ncbi:MAG: hypothetical protein H7A32_02540 [Deltaproteobacteria bacterium]|nr:hypothetical protein [Deltaproteobacteria bacterium]